MLKTQLLSMQPMVSNKGTKRAGKGGKNSITHNKVINASAPGIPLDFD